MLEKAGLRDLRVLLWFLFAFLCLVLQQCPREAFAEEEPELYELREWYPAQDGTMILEYHSVSTEGVSVWRFKHAIKSPPDKVPACNEVVVEGNEIHLITQEANPVKYIIKRENDGFSPEFNLDFTYEDWK